MHEYCGENLGNEPKLVRRTTANPNFQTAPEQLPLGVKVETQPDEAAGFWPQRDSPFSRVLPGKENRPTSMHLPHGMTHPVS